MKLNGTPSDVRFWKQRYEMVVNAEDWKQHQTAPYVLTINLGLKWRHIVAISSTIGAGIAALIGAGWLVLPAKQTDMTAITDKVAVIEADIRETRDAVNRMQGDVDSLLILIKGVDRVIRTSGIPIPERHP